MTRVELRPRTRQRRVVALPGCRGDSFAGRLRSSSTLDAGAAILAGRKNVPSGPDLEDRRRGGKRDDATSPRGRRGPSSTPGPGSPLPPTRSTGPGSSGMGPPGETPGTRTRRRCTGALGSAHRGCRGGSHGPRAPRRRCRGARRLHIPMMSTPFPRVPRNTSRSAVSATRALRRGHYDRRPGSRSPSGPG
jgi:hypothetical protein